MDNLKKFIVTTTIQPPTEATLRFSKMKDWTLIVVGDLKTPHERYRDVNCIYLSPEQQQLLYPDLSFAIGWNCIQRRNIGFVYAYKMGADIVATVDDDNIPYKKWGETILIGRETELPTFENNMGVFNPLSFTNFPELWHRGYPLELIKESVNFQRGKFPVTPQIQADLWDGDPDVDAVCRKIYNPTELNLEVKEPYTTKDFTPFNSQNTFISRKVLPYYMCIPHIGRMDDIWGGYICEYLTGERPVYCSSTVYQERNPHSLNKDFLDEVRGYTQTLDLLTNIESWETYLPNRARSAFELYRKEFTK